ncbi:MAG TPA: hypothetical protein VFQ23_05255 [Anaerolineales bacterium]|nr:hypothetical protein [Anaerolineales bacterium]
MLLKDAKSEALAPLIAEITQLSILQTFPGNIVSGIHATLIARINQGPIFVAGNEITFEAESTGNLLLRMNDKSTSDNSGSIVVSVKVMP